MSGVEGGGEAEGEEFARMSGVEGGGEAERQRGGGGVK